MKFAKKMNVSYDLGDNVYNVENVIEFFVDGDGHHHLKTSEGGVFAVAKGRWVVYSMVPVEAEPETLFDAANPEAWVSTQNHIAPSGLYVVMIKDDLGAEGLITGIATTYGRGEWTISVPPTEDYGYWDSKKVEVVAYLPTNFGLKQMAEIRKEFGNGDEL